MPIEKRYTEEGIGIEIIGKGRVIGKEICDALDEIYSSEMLLKQKYQIWNFTDVEDFDFPKKDFDRMVKLDVKASQTNPNIVIAVVGEKDLIFGISRMWETHMEIEESGFETMTFRKREDADAWISSKVNGI